MLILSLPLFTIRIDPITSHIFSIERFTLRARFHYHLFPPSLLRNRLLGMAASLDLYFSLCYSFFQVSILYPLTSFSATPGKESPLYYSFIIMSMNVFIDVSLQMTDSAANLISDAEASIMSQYKSLPLLTGWFNQSLFHFVTMLFNFLSTFASILPTEAHYFNLSLSFGAFALTLHSHSVFQWRISDSNPRLRLRSSSRDDPFCPNLRSLTSLSLCTPVENIGFEPMTPCLQSRCSSQLS